MDRLNQNPEIGRVLRASTTGFAVGSRLSQLELPAFGALVKAQPVNQGEEVFGLITNIAIDDDPLVRRLVLAENPRPETINDQRNNRLLPIEMSVLAVGYRRGETIVQTLPPRPPLNLDPVVICLWQEEVRAFSDNLAYLRLILGQRGSGLPIDQLLVAHVLDVYRRRGNDDAWAATVIQELIELLRSNYDVLVPTLEAISAVLPERRAG